MTMSLYWSALPKGRPLNDDLKFALRKKFGEPIQADLDESILPYLQGLADGGLEEAETLITAIGRHGEIRIWES